VPEPPGEPRCPWLLILREMPQLLHGSKFDSAPTGRPDRLGSPSAASRCGRGWLLTATLTGMDYRGVVCRVCSAVDANVGAHFAICGRRGMRVTVIPEGLKPLESDYSWVRDADDWLVLTLRPLWFVGR
jgi:hypothetical protein